MWFVLQLFYGVQALLVLQLHRKQIWITLYVSIFFYDNYLHFVSTNKPFIFCFDVEISLVGIIYKDILWKSLVRVLNILNNDIYMFAGICAWLAARYIYGKFW